MTLCVQPFTPAHARSHPPARTPGAPAWTRATHQSGLTARKAGMAAYVGSDAPGGGKWAQGQGCSQVTAPERRRSTIQATRVTIPSRPAAQWSAPSRVHESARNGARVLRLSLSLAQACPSSSRRSRRRRGAARRRMCPSPRASPSPSLTLAPVASRAYRGEESGRLCAWI